MQFVVDFCVFPSEISASGQLRWHEVQFSSEFAEVEGVALDDPRFWPWFILMYGSMFCAAKLGTYIKMRLLESLLTFRWKRSF
jgi:hypothetical protein